MFYQAFEKKYDIFIYKQGRKSEGGGNFKVGAKKRARREP